MGATTLRPAVQSYLRNRAVSEDQVRTFMHTLELPHMGPLGTVLGCGVWEAFRSSKGYLDRPRLWSYFNNWQRYVSRLQELLQKGRNNDG